MTYIKSYSKPELYSTLATLFLFQDRDAGKFAELFLQGHRDRSAELFQLWAASS